MRCFSLMCALGCLVLVPPAVVGQHDHASTAQRGARVMGFDQDATSHHFRLHPDGGAIDVSVKHASDAANRDAIRAHLPHVARMFADGNFEAPMLVHDTTRVPGAGVMAARRERIRYHYVETPNGGRVDIVTTDREALEAVHQFLRFQIADHRTGDPLTITPR